MSLTLDKVSVSLSGRCIVEDVCLEVPTGSFVGLLGPNGSGKSTLLKSIYRVHRPSSGRILVDDQDLLALSPKAAARRVAVVAQDASIEFAFTVAELVLAGRTPHKGLLEDDDDDDRAAMDEALARVGCSQLAHRYFNTLSGGERQRVLIARALAQDADHLLLDEPTNHLDIRYQMQVLELVASLRITVLAALHDLSLAALYCDAVYLLADGRIVRGGGAKDVITTELVQRVYGADVLIIDHPEHNSPHLVPRRASGRQRMHSQQL